MSKIIEVTQISEMTVRIDVPDDETVVEDE